MRKLIALLRHLGLTRLPLVEQVSRWELPFPVYLQGFWIRWLKLRALAWGAFEPETTNLMKRVVRPGYSVVDIGAESVILASFWLN